jgi:hypothetical protein
VPTWENTDRTWPAFRKRHGVRRRIGQMLTGIIPTIELEKSWAPDQLDIYGANGSTDGAAALELHSVALHNPSDDLELLVWKVESKARTTGGFSDPTETIRHLFTPLQTYNPTLNPAPIPIFISALSTATATGDAARLARAHLDCGSNPVLMVLTVDFGAGPVATTMIGPSNSHSLQRFNMPPAFSFWFPHGQWTVHYEATGSCPPLRVKPGQKLAVAETANSPTGTHMIEANFWWSERPFDG